MQKLMINRMVSFLKIVFPLALLVLAGFEIEKFARDLNYGLLQRELAQIQTIDMVVTLLIVAAAFIPMFFYDGIMVKLLGIDISKGKLVKQSLIANTFSNVFGFGGLIGLVIRTYFYRSRKLRKKTVLTTIASVSLFYLTGISLLSWIILAGYRNIPLLVDTKWLYLAVIGVSLYLPVLLFIIHTNQKSTDMSIKVRTQLVFVSFWEWGAIFFVIWFLARMLHIHISFHDLFPVFIVASCAGIISMIPGGLGSFDLVFIWGTDILGIQDEKVMVLLMLYRICYLFLPFIMAGVLFAKIYWERRNNFG